MRKIVSFPGNHLHTVDFPHLCFIVYSRISRVVGKVLVTPFDRAHDANCMKSFPHGRTVQVVQVKSLAQI